MDRMEFGVVRRRHRFEFLETSAMRREEDPERLELTPMGIDLLASHVEDERPGAQLVLERRDARAIDLVGLDAIREICPEAGEFIAHRRDLEIGPMEAFLRVDPMLLQGTGVHRGILEHPVEFDIPSQEVELHGSLGRQRARRRKAEHPLVDA
jgi:hypothetical protein